MRYLFKKGRKMNYARLIVESDKNNKPTEINQCGMRKSDVDQMGDLEGFSTKHVARNLFRRKPEKTKTKA